MKTATSPALMSFVALFTVAVLAGCADPLGQGIPAEQVAARQRAERESLAAQPDPGPAPKLAALTEDKDLVAYYPFDGDVQDASGHGNDGKVEGKLCFTGGVAGQAARFRGAEDPSFIRVPNADSLKFDSEFSAACWVRIVDWNDRDGPGKPLKYNHQELVAKSSDVQGFVIGAHSWTKPIVGICASNRTDRKAEAGAATAALLNGWMHLAVVCDADGIRVYHDGEPVKTVSKAVDFSVANTRDLFIGRMGNGYAGTMNGLMDELRLYRRALTGSEIARLAGRRR